MKHSTTRLIVAVACLMVVCLNSYSQERKTMFNHIALSVYDLQKSADFYRDIIGLDSIPEPFKIGKHAWFKIGPGLSLHLVNDASEIKEHSQNTHTCFSVPSLEGFIAKLNKHGVRYYNAGGEPDKVNSRPDGVRQLYIKDPDGYWIEINDEQM